MDPELKGYLEGMRQDLTQQVDVMRQDLTQQIVESRHHAEQLNQETRRDLTAHAEQGDTRLIRRPAPPNSVSGQSRDGG